MLAITPRVYHETQTMLTNATGRSPNIGMVGIADVGFPMIYGLMMRDEFYEVFTARIGGTAHVWERYGVGPLIVAQQALMALIGKLKGGFERNPHV